MDSNNDFVGGSLQTILNNSLQTKYTIQSIFKPIESNNLSLTMARLFSLESSNKIHPLFDTWGSFWYSSDTMLGITILHNDMILSNLSINSIDFTYL